MKIKSILAAFMMVLATLGVAGASQASAAGTSEADAGNFCSGQGIATLGSGLWAVGLGPAKTTTFSITVDPCLAGVTQGSVTASGTLTGNCGRSTGKGTIGGQKFNLETAGTVLILTPDPVTGPSTVVGAGNAVADPTVQNNSCANGTATRFIVTGAVHW
ncbi:MAG TPA: hypothetical protein VM287_00385 [Egibacteraceae bacterium]|nr:hypothetical protein [Egibacteraceae bacterium]